MNLLQILAIGITPTLSCQYESHHFSGFKCKNG